MTNVGRVRVNAAARQFGWRIGQHVQKPGVVLYTRVGDYRTTFIRVRYSTRGGVLSASTVYRRNAVPGYEKADQIIELMRNAP